MKLPRWLPWAGTAGFVLVLIVSVFLYAENRELIGEAQQADRVAEQAREQSERDSVRAAAARDSLQASREREEAYRARLDSALTELAAESGEAAEEVQVQTVALDSTLAELSRRVPDELVGLVTRAMQQADSLSAAHQSFRRAMEARVEKLGQRSQSLQRQLTRTDSTLVAVERELASVREELSATREARDKWRDAADPPLIQQLLGRNLLKGVATVGSGVAAWMVGEEKGAAGWALAKGASLVAE